MVFQCYKEVTEVILAECAIETIKQFIYQIFCVAVFYAKFCYMRYAIAQCFHTELI